MGNNFLLQNDWAAALYHDYAAPMPIIDYHCHLSPADIAANRQFEHISAIWLEGDHYKWRAMRANGVAEQFITGNAAPREKFQKWAETVPATLRNPLFHWTHLELRRYFHIETLLQPDSAQAIYEQCTEALQRPDFSTKALLQKMNVEMVGTTDDPADSLKHHLALQDFNIRIYPSFRPDQAIFIEKTGFVAYLERLGHSSGVRIHSFDTLLEALYRRMDHFAALGCRIADHGLERLYTAAFSRSAVDSTLRARLDGKIPDEEAMEAYRSALLYELGLAYARRGWVQQFHLGALRNNNTRLLDTLGPDTGFDSIGDVRQAQHLSRFLDRLDRENLLAKTILYNLNPADNAIFATMAGNFNDGSIPGKIQWGSAWWFLDQKDGMEQQIDALSRFGLLSRFVGMLTDSRSFLSFPRHEYFRRILCNLIGKDVENGELPADMALLGQMVRDICYYNAKRYFEL